MRSRFLLVLSGTALLIGCAQQRPSNLVTEFYDMSDSKFSVRAIAPPAAVRELAVCKAVWFAEKRNARSLSLSNPAYSAPKNMPAYVGKVPPDWVVLTATAYLTAPNPDGNPIVTVADKAPECRSMWPWYQ
ncbi:hypothetical protein [Rhodopila sp.]|uniref:hypothetical protein n=1 Tax=Rhodopila sp. TaxID=2480087 RepID=UPI003D0A6468